MRGNGILLLVLAAGLVLSWQASTILQERASSRLQRSFLGVAESRIQTLQREIDSNMALLRSVAALFQSQSTVSPEQFAAFVSSTGEDHALRSLVWVPRVTREELPGFLERTRAMGLPDFRIHVGGAAAAPVQDEYFPILYVEPWEENRELVGFDLSSELTSLEPMGRSRELELPVAVSHGTNGDHDFVVFLPIYHDADPATGIRFLRGFVRGTISIEDVVRESREGLKPLRAWVALHDPSARPGRDLLFSEGGHSDHDSQVPGATGQIELAGRQWEVRSRPLDTVYQVEPWLAWAPFAMGSLFTVLFVAYLRSLAGRTAQVQQLVTQRTAELEDEIRERKGTLRKLRQSEEQFRDLFENSQALIWTHDLDGVILTSNPAAAQSLGHAPEELIGKNLRDFILPTERHTLTEYLDSIRKQSTAKGVLRLYTKNGATRIWLYHNSRHDEEEGQKSYVRGHALDVTESKRAERELERLSRQNQLILDSAGEGIYGVNLAGECSFVNPAAAKFTGYSQDDLLQAEVPVHEILHYSRVDGSDYPWGDSPVFKTLQDGKVRRVQGDVMWRRNGTFFPVEYVCTPLVERGRIVGAVVTFQDVTERTKIEQMKNEFVSIVSHELRTPLTSIRGSLGLLAGGVLRKTPERAEGMLKIALNNTDRLVRLINDILDIERLESGRVTIEKRECRLEDLMKQAVDVMDAMGSENGVTLQAEATDCPIHVDPDRILQVLTNLLSNAIKFSPRGGKVTLSAEPRKADVLVKVSDVGRGIPSDKLDKIFERFQQVDASDARKKGGTGLGLAICRTIVEQHGGEIWVESVMGAGSTFFFTLPLKPAARIRHSWESFESTAL
ncbi:MAG: PAS domain S-box protein [Armatimonadetes bacterium]|nr:PAS domain S-box protein [Armatimonadota bacterium]